MIKKYLIGIFWGERLEWNSNRNPDQILSLVGEANEGTWIERLFVPGIGASTRKNKFKLANMSVGNLPFSGNSFAHILSGRVYPTPTGSRIVAQFRLAIPTFIFTCIWLGGAFLIGISGGTAGIYQSLVHGQSEKILTSLLMLLFPIAGTAFLNLFRMLASGNERKIRATLVEALGEPDRKTVI